MNTAMASRRHALRATAVLAAALLAGCGALGNATSLTPVSIASDAALVVNGVQKAVAGIESAFPALIPAATASQLSSYLTTAGSVLSQVSATVAAASSAPAVQQIDAALNAVVTALAGISAIPAPYSTALSAAQVLLPVLEAFVNQYLPGATATAALPMPAAGMTPDEARSVLAGFVNS